MSGCGGGSVGLRLASLIMALPVLPAVAVAQATDPHRVEPRAGVIEVDGQVGASEWEGVAAVPLPFEWYPGDNVAAPVETEMLVTFDAQYLYVAFRARDPEPGSIRAHVTARDNLDLLERDDRVGVYLDTFADGRRAYHFQVNALGVQSDAVFTDATGGDDVSWDAIWTSAGRITSDGYEVEMRIPLGQLRFKPGSDEQAWRFEAVRSYPRRTLHEISSRRTDRDLSCRLCQNEWLVGVRGASGGNHLQVTPSWTSQRTSSRPGEGSDVASKASAFLRWGPAANVSFTATANPDFAQVEADAAQLEANTRFALSFPERRPFFLEGAETFQTPLAAVFTRTVADPRWAAKGVARAGAHTFGAFGAADRINNLLLPTNQSSDLYSTVDRTVSSAVRYRYDLGGSSALGGLYTDRTGGLYANRVGGVDGNLRLGDMHTLSFQWLHSWTRDTDAVRGQTGREEERFGGDAVRVKLVHSSRNWIAFGSLERLTPGFRADAGFMPRADYRTLSADVQYVIWGAGSRLFDQINVGASAFTTSDLSGRLTDREATLNAFYGGPANTRVRVWLKAREESVAEQLFEGRSVAWSLSSTPVPWMALRLRSEAGDRVDLSSVRSGKGLIVEPSVSLLLGRRVAADVGVALHDITDNGERLVRERLVQGGIQYSLSSRVHARLTFRRRAVDEPERDRFFLGEALLSYEADPQTVFFLGFSETRTGEEARGRLYYLKASYAFVR